MKDEEARRVASRRAGKRSSAMYPPKGMDHAGAFGLGMAPLRNCGLWISDCGLDGAFGRFPGLFGVFQHGCSVI